MPAKSKKPKMGRPRKPAAIRKDCQLSITMTAIEQATLEKIAYSEGVTVSELLLRRFRQEGKV